MEVSTGKNTAVHRRQPWVQTWPPMGSEACPVLGVVVTSPAGVKNRVTYISNHHPASHREAKDTLGELAMETGKTGP